MSTGIRWFPGQESEQRFAPGWLLAGGERWDGTGEDGADLTSLHLHAPRTLVLELRLQSPVLRLIEFTGLTELQIDGDLQWEGATDVGWEVLDTSMLVAAQPRADGLVVYVLQLPQALLCFASVLGALRPDL